MKMAKAGKEEVEAALRLANILEGVARGEYPMEVDKDGNWVEHEDEPNWFEENDRDHLRVFYERTMACVTGGLFRVVGGMMVLIDPRNEIIDPDKDYLDLHPKYATLVENAIRYQALRRVATVNDPVSAAMEKAMNAFAETNKDITPEAYDGVADAAVAAMREGGA